MGRLERLKIKATKAWEKGNDKKFDRIDKKRADMQLPGLTAALQAKSPYMMYGEKSDTMTGGSPLAKTGCSKTYKKGALKAEGGVEEVDLTTSEEKPLDPADSASGKNKPYTGPMTFKSKTKPKYFKKGDSKSKAQRKRK